MADTVFQIYHQNGDPHTELKYRKRLKFLCESITFEIGYNFRIKTQDSTHVILI